MPVAKVMQPHRQTELAQLAFRGFFEDVDHPVEAGPGTAPCRCGLPPAQTGSTPAPRRCSASTTTSAHRTGPDAAEIAELEADGVIGQAPA